MKKSLFTTALLIGAMVGSQAYAKELAVCSNSEPGGAVYLFSEISCQDSTKPLDKDGYSKPYKTTLYQLYKSGWKIISTRSNTISSWNKLTRAYETYTAMAQIYLEK